MAISDQLTQLAARAKELEDRAAAAKTKQKAELQNDVKRAREAAQAQANTLSQHAEEGKDRLSTWWDNVQRSWNEEMSSIRETIDLDRSEHDLEKAQRAAYSADEDAEFAIEYVYAAIEEAEYAVLDAELAHMEVDELESANVSA